jgi:plasmid stabilization system protein ParE
VPIYTGDARDDLQAIREQIAKDSAQRAFEKAALIDDACNLLDKLPRIGRVFDGNLRLFTKAPWIIVYEPTEAGALIHRVFDSRQDWRSRLVNPSP